MALTEKTVSWLCSYSIMVCVISAFDVQCPHSSHRQIQAKAFCNRSEISKYSCLYDINNQVYTESCNRSPDYVSPGKRYVIMGSRTGSDCSSERYQPFRFWSNELSECVYLKSLCSEIGQKIYDFRSTEEDSSCSCDYTKGYGFVTQPRNIQYCIPSKEDCSCLLVQCPANNTLAHDYKCRPGLKNNSAENMETRIIKPSISDEDDGIVVDGRWPMIIILVFCICCIVIAFIFVFIEQTIVPAEQVSTDNETTDTYISTDVSINQKSEHNTKIPGVKTTTYVHDIEKASDDIDYMHDNVAATQLKFEVKTIDPRLQLICANKALLLEEIDPILFLEACSKRGFDHFKEANIECIPERRLRTAKLLDILEKKILVTVDNLMDVFIKILEDMKLNFMVKILKLYQKMQLIDAALLRKNIIKHIVSIVDEVDLEDIEDEIISRCGLHEDVVEELYSQYPEGSEGRIIAMIVDILGQGDSAVCMFIDILFNSGIDSTLLEKLSGIDVAATQLKFEVKTIDPRLQLLCANKDLLLEEIEPILFLEACSKGGFDHFKDANIERIPERRLRTAKLLDILEKKILDTVDNLMDVFIKILDDTKVNVVVKRLKLYKKMQLIDAALLRKNIEKHIESIVDEVDLKDIKDEIISRNGLHEDMIEELHSQYPEGSEGIIAAMIVDILGQGDSAVVMFIDVLFNSGIDLFILEELSDIEHGSDDIDCIDDNDNGPVF